MNLHLFILLLLVVFQTCAHQAFANVVINELMWVGSDLSTADEWIELLHTGSGATATDISGWSITSKNSKGIDQHIVTFESGTILHAGQLFLVANYSASESRLLSEPDFVTKQLVLPNTKLHLKLLNGSGVIMEEVDDGVGAPFAGGKNSQSGTYISMQKVADTGSGNTKEGWANSFTFIGFDDGAPILGTPGYHNQEGYKEDIFAPFEVTDLVGSLSSGSLVFQWTVSNSIDLASQVITISSLTSTGELIKSVEPELNKFSFDDPFITSGATVKIQSIDRLGNISSGAVLHIFPLVDHVETQLTFSGVYITELLPNPIGSDDYEWIEIGNLRPESVSLQNWIIEDDTRSYLLGSESGNLVLGPNEYLVIKKSESTISLSNKSDTIRLLSGTTIIDSIAYANIPEGVSFGRNSSGSHVPYCVPTQGSKNIFHEQEIAIDIQSTNGQTTSGSIVGVGNVSVNLIALSQSGSMQSTQCQWVYSDGYSSDSCNPPSHKFSEVGHHFVTLKAINFCGTTIQQSIDVFVEKKTKEAKKSDQNLKKNSQEACQVTHANGVEISEIYPNPYGSEKDEEWVELQNTTDDTVSLCGWKIDDIEGGSKSYSLDHEIIYPNQFLILPRSQTKIALNNSKEEIRLFGPDSILQSVYIAKSVEGETYALRDDGHFVWSLFPTPGTKNKFRTAERRYDQDKVLVTAALPNPHGKDIDTEWIEISNVSDDVQKLDGWKLDNRPGSSAPFALDGLALESSETRRFLSKQTGVSLTNNSDVARLLDPDGYVTSIFGWTDAISGHIYRLPRIVTQKVNASVIRVIDGDTIDIALTNPDQLDRMPPSLKRKWLSVTNSDKASIRVRLIGIDTPETVHPTKKVEKFGKEAGDFAKRFLENKDVLLEFDQEIWDKYDRLLAYVYVDDTLVQSELLRHGLAYAYIRFPFARSDQFLAYQQEAKQNKLGLWIEPELIEYIQEQEDVLQQEMILESEGLSLEIQPSGGMVATGSVIHFLPSVDADIFVSVNSGSYIPSSGSLVIDSDITITAYASKMWSGSILRSETVQTSFVVPKSSYSTDIVISEVYPSPKKGEQEWIELFNPTSTDISLTGWTLDDQIESGSKPWVIDSLIVPANGYAVVTKDVSSLALNNSGDSVVLSSPDGMLQIAMDFKSVKKGKSVIEGGCITDVATRNTKNICLDFDDLDSKKDSDNDLLSDEIEIHMHKTNPFSADTDGDLLPDIFEVKNSLDPFHKTKIDRKILVMYKKFIHKNVSLKIKKYKTKPSKIYGKSNLLSSVAITIRDKDDDDDDEVINFDINQEDQDWTTYIDKTHSPGQYTIDIQLQDILGNSFLYSEFSTINISENKKIRQRRESSVVPRWAKFLVKFVPFYTTSDVNVLKVPSVISELQSYEENISNPANVYDSTRIELVAFLFMLIASILLCIKNVYNYLVLQKG